MLCNFACSLKSGEWKKRNWLRGILVFSNWAEGMAKAQCTTFPLGSGGCSGAVTFRVLYFSGVPPRKGRLICSHVLYVARGQWEEEF